MVVQFLFSLFFLVSFQDIKVSVPPKVTVEVDQSASFEGQSVPVILSVIHERRQVIDPNSFVLRDNKLPVIFIEEVLPAKSIFSAKDPEAILVTKYRFMLSPQDAGLYLLPPISCKVDNLLVRSNSTTYTISQPVSSSTLRLEARVVEKEPYYPGQKLQFEYRIYSDKPVQLTKEDLALFNFTPFRNIGAPQILDQSTKSQTIEVICQFAVANGAGNFLSRPSQIIGFAFTKDGAGNTVLIPPPIKAEAPALTITISPFPQEGKPSSFNGALGIFSWEGRVISERGGKIGEPIVLELDCKGKGDLDTVQLPDFARQNGFKQNFTLPDQMPVGQIDRDVKKFLLELRPLNDTVSMIPQIEFSSFDPKSGQYVTVILPSIPLKFGLRHQAVEKMAPTESRLSPIVISRNVVLDDAILKKPFLSSWLILQIVVGLILLFASQYCIKRALMQRKEKKETSHDLFIEAIKSRDNPDHALSVVSQALLLRLFEIGEVKERPFLAQDLKESGLQGEVRRFLLSIQEERFRENAGQFEARHVLDDAISIYTRMKKEVKKGP